MLAHQDDDDALVKFSAKWGDKLRAIRRDWGWDEEYGIPCEPPDNWREIVKGVNSPSIVRFNPTVYALSTVTRYKMLILVSDEHGGREELWAIRNGQWTRMSVGTDAYFDFSKIHGAT